MNFYELFKKILQFLNIENQNLRKKQMQDSKQQFLQKQRQRQKQKQKEKQKQKKVKLKQTIKNDRQSSKFPTRKKQYFTMIHNQIKQEYHNRQYQYACDMLFDLQPPQHHYLPLYYQDLLTSVNKLLKYYLLRKQTSIELINLYLQRGKQTIIKFYQLFLVNQSLTSQHHTLNQALAPKITRFLNITINFLMNYSFILAIQSNFQQAKHIYQINHYFCIQIITTSIRNYKLLKKISQFLLNYASFLIHIKQIDKSLSVLSQNLKIQTNIALILSYRLSNKTKNIIKHNKLQLFNRLIAIFFNMSQCYIHKKQLHWSYYCLKQCQTLSKLKTQLSQKDVKLNIADIIKSFEIFHNQYQQLKQIAKYYFHPQHIQEQISQHKTVSSFSPSTIEHHLLNPNKNNTQPVPPFIISNAMSKSKKILRRSISLQQKLNNQNNKKIFKEFGKEVLFFGVNLFEKPKQKCLSNNSKQINSANYSYNKNQLSKAYLNNSQQLQCNPPQSKLKKHHKAIKNNIFKPLQKPIQFEILQHRIQKMWNQQVIQNNKLKEKTYLLKYKKQYLNHKDINSENKNIFEEIQINNHHKHKNLRQSSKPPEIEDQQKQNGVNLLKSIILQNFKKFDLKKSQTFSILKNKTKNIQQTKRYVYSNSEQSVNFLLNKLKKQQQKRKITKQVQNNKRYFQNQNKPIDVSSIFLTKDTIAIPNLFLSYIASSALYFQVLSVILQYGLTLVI